MPCVILRYDRDLCANISLSKEPFPLETLLERQRNAFSGKCRYISGYLNSPLGKSVLGHLCKSIVDMANINATELKGSRILIPPNDTHLGYERFNEDTRQAEQNAPYASSGADDLFHSPVQRPFKEEL
jgi:type I restriction enzyme S subunit